ncbi:hypothetical protein ACFSTH_17025 [Paenibacillus yanchengensis]|uniref:Methyltransferase n=1 Tax=Paenibacillus yanchengensis TaxID=2035833 RepID=A0ABW4YQ19_9BACL
MSRSWERQVRKNMQKVNQTRKKSGNSPISLYSEKGKQSVFKGRNYVIPFLLILFILGYLFIVTAQPDFVANGMFWVTVIAYVVLAIMFFFRRPYLTIGKDFVQSRRITGDKTLYATGIKEIRLQKDSVVIAPKTGAAWTYSKVLNRFATEQMGQKLIEFGKKNDVNVVEH